MRANGRANDTVRPPICSSVPPSVTTLTKRSISASLNSRMSLTSQYAAYNSSIVNSGLCVVSMPSLRKIRPIS